MNEDSHRNGPSIRVVLLLWLLLSGCVAGGVVVLAIVGQPVLDWIAQHDPSPKNRRELGSLDAVKRARGDELAGGAGSDPGAPIAESLSLSECLRRAGMAETRGEIAVAQLWLALDAHGRARAEIAFEHEREAVRASGGDPAQITDGKLNAILPGYGEYREAISPKRAPATTDGP